MQAIYRCGCRADGDNVGLSCPMHGEREITEDEAIDILGKWGASWILARKAGSTTCGLSAAGIAWAFRRIRQLEDQAGACARTAKPPPNSGESRDGGASKIMATQCCWDCDYTNQDGKATKRGTPRKDVVLRCHAPVPISLFCLGKCQVEPTEGANCPCFLPRKAKG
jgi:hypothetical protein